MRKTVLALALSAITAGVATPALAHDNDRYPGGNRAEAAYLTPARNADVRRDIDLLDSRIDRAYSNRRISYNEAVSLRRDARVLQQTYRRYADRGLSGTEYRELQRRVASISYRLKDERHDRDGHKG